MTESSNGNGSEVAQRLYTIVKQQPAIHFRGLKRAADVSSNGQLRHHIDQLAGEDALLEIEDGGYTRFFIPGQHPPELRNGLARFARRVPRTIAKLLLDGPKSRTELRAALGCADSTLGYHLNRMLEQGDLQRDRMNGRSLYSLPEPDFVRQVLHELAEDGERSNNGHGSPENGNGDASGNGNGHAPENGNGHHAP